MGAARTDIGWYATARNRIILTFMLGSACNSLWFRPNTLGMRRVLCERGVASWLASRRLGRLPWTGA